ncbi:unnamed protein product [Moneuplotes crassus]|uniref:Lysozyme n=1 Tax=Euplotes crassus TaxID=5936 RepID=A0AAD1UK87_EUPCR|nr:unnamed protein product [Moneuplotes crassus]
MSSDWQLKQTYGEKTVENQGRVQECTVPTAFSEETKNSFPSHTSPSGISPSLERMIKLDEGCRSHSYVDTTGHRTIGYGYNLERSFAKEELQSIKADYNYILSGKHGLSHEQMTALLHKDLHRASNSAHKIIPNFKELPSDIQEVMTSMIYNLGPSGFKKFTKLRKGLENKDYKEVARQMEQSVWAKQVKSRCTRAVELVNKAAQDPEKDLTSPKQDIPENFGNPLDFDLDSFDDKSNKKPEEFPENTREIEQNTSTLPGIEVKANNLDNLPNSLEFRENLIKMFCQISEFLT